jgi:hypothetical protein
VLRGLMYTVQRMRSSMCEELGVRPGNPPDADATERLVNNDLFRWVLGDGCVLPALAGLVDRYDTTGVLVPMDLYNMLVIATRLQPEIGAFYEFFTKRSPDYVPLPTPVVLFRWVGDPEPTQ